MLLKRNELGQMGSPFVRLELATGHKHYGVRGWVKREATGERDNVSVDALIQRYGESLRRECQQAGFEPAFVQPLRQQSPAARAAARAWADRVLAEGRS